MSPATRISAVDLFCGAGGLTHGLSKALIDVRLGVDIDIATQHPFVANNRAKFMLADVRELKAETIKRMFLAGTTTLLAGCAPCQPFSTYSQKSAKRDKARRKVSRSNDWSLVERFAELVEEVQPDLVTMENVPPLLRAPVFKRLRSRLNGYWVDARVVDCLTVGLPQTRKRLVLLASRLGPVRVPDFSSPPQTVRSTIGELPAIAAGETSPVDRLHVASSLSEINMRRIQVSQQGGTWRDWPDELRARCHTRITGSTYPSVYGRMSWAEPAPTITTQCFGYGNGRFGHPEQDRAISLREAAMLQGFPRSYSFLPDEVPVSFATIGRLIGNAVPVTLAAAIGEALVRHVQTVNGHSAAE